VTMAEMTPELEELCGKWSKSYARKRCDSAIADDLMQAARIRLWRTAESRAGILRLIARRAMIDMLRSPQYRAMPRQSAQGVIDSHEQECNDRLDVDAILLKLGVRDREVVRLYWLGGHTCSEIGQTCGLTRVRISQILVESMSKMEKLVGKDSSVQKPLDMTRCAAQGCYRLFPTRKTNGIEKKYCRPACKARAYRERKKQEATYLLP